MVIMMVKIDADNLHILKEHKHNECDWFWEDELECTNWCTFVDPEDYAILECFTEKGV